MKRASTLLLTCLLLCGAVRAAEPQFQSTIVTQSRTYQRQKNSFRVVGIPGSVGNTVDVSRVTVALDGFLITGEWEPETVRSLSAKDFRRGTDVLAAVNRNRLLLKTGAGDEVTAKIVSREKQKTIDASRRQHN